MKRGGREGGHGGRRRYGARARGLALAATFCIVVLATLLGAPRDASATNAVSSCSASSTGLTFPNYDLLGQAQQTGTGTITVQCTGTGTDTIHVALSAGNSGSGTCTTRKMELSSSALTYNIYQDSALSTVWCSGSAKRLAVSITFPSKTTAETVNQNVTMYAEVTAGQSVAPGTYTDTPTATVYWTGGNSTASNVAVQDYAPSACSVSVSALGFGNYTGAVIQAQTTVTATCSLTSPYTIALGGGSYLNGVQRRMGDTLGDYIPYALYSNSTRTTAWGDGSALGATVAGTGTGVAQNYPVYGSTGAQSATPPGNYADSVVVTVSY
jgi:spore coat protein U-like protein